MVSKVTKRIRLFDNLDSKLKKTDRDSIKRKVADLLVKEVSKDLNMSRSPVSGNSFKPLSKDYKAEKKKAGKGGRANMKFNNDMRPDIEGVDFRDGIDFGIFTFEADKADAHNQHSGKAKSWARKNGFPQRKFIPEKTDNPKNVTGYKNEIEKKVVALVNKEFKAIIGREKETVKEFNRLLLDEANG